MRSLNSLIGRYLNTEALYEGAVSSSRLRLKFVERNPVHSAFPQVVNDLAFDVSELAIVTYLQARAAGVPLVLLPIVLLGRFQHEFLVASADRPRSPAELVDARIGVRAYSVTTGVWLRGMLQDDYGVDSHSVTWVAATSAHVTGYRDPDNVVYAESGKSLEELLAAGDIDAAVLGTPADHPGPWPTTPVIADPQAAAAAWFQQRRIVPINHVLVVREELMETSPELVVDIYRMFRDARAKALDDPRLAPDVRGVTPADVLPVGGDQMRPGLELISRYSAAQGLIPYEMTVKEMFGDVSNLLG